MTEPVQWTRRHWIIATLAMSNVIALVLFGTIFPPQFAALRTTVIAVWGALGALLLIANVRHGRDPERAMSVTAFIAHPLFQVIVVLTTLTWPLIAAFHALDKRDIHRVSIKLREMNPRGTGTLQRLDTTTARAVYQLSRGTTQWTTFVPRGDYELTLRVPGYEEWRDTLVVPLFSLNVNSTVDSLRPERARLTLLVSPRVIDLAVHEDRSGRVIDSAHYSNQDTVSITLPRGRFWIVGTSTGFMPDSIDVSIASGSPIRDTLSLRPLPARDTRARVTLQLTPSDMEVIVDDVLQQRRTPTTIHVRPGQHVLEARKPSSARSEFYWRWMGTLSPGQHLTFHDSVRPVYLYAVTVSARDKSRVHTYHMDGTAPHFASAQITDHHVFLVRRGAHRLIKRRDGAPMESIQFFVRQDTVIEF